MNNDERLYWLLFGVVVATVLNLLAIKLVLWCRRDVTRTSPPHSNGQSEATGTGGKKRKTQWD